MNDVNIFGSKIVVNNLSELEKMKNKVMDDKVKKDMLKFANMLRENMIMHIKTYPFKSHKFQSYLSRERESMRERIINAIKRAPIKRGTDSNGNYKVWFEIDNKYAKMLNDGTGIYNKYNPHPITPRGGHRYMFIPGYEFARTLMAKKFKKMGISEDKLKSEMYKAVRGRRVENISYKYFSMLNKNGK